MHTSLTSWLAGPISLGYQGIANKFSIFTNFVISIAPYVITRLAGVRGMGCAKGSISKAVVKLSAYTWICNVSFIPNSSHSYHTFVKYQILNRARHSELVYTHPSLQMQLHSYAQPITLYCNQYTNRSIFQKMRRNFLLHYICFYMPIHVHCYTQVWTHDFQTCIFCRPFRDPV